MGGESNDKKPLLHRHIHISDFICVFAYAVANREASNAIFLDRLTPNPPTEFQCSDCGNTFTLSSFDSCECRASIMQFVPRKHFIVSSVMYSGRMIS